MSKQKSPLIRKALLSLVVCFLVPMLVTSATPQSALAHEELSSQIRPFQYMQPDLFSQNGSTAQNCEDGSASIFVEPDSESVIAGEEAIFEVIITNTGDAILGNIEVSHVQLPDCDGVIERLEPGNQFFYRCEAYDITADLSLDISLTAVVWENVCTINASGSGEVKVVPPMPVAYLYLPFAQ